MGGVPRRTPSARHRPRRVAGAPRPRPDAEPNCRRGRIASRGRLRRCACGPRCHGPGAAVPVPGDVRDGGGRQLAATRALLRRPISMAASTPQRPRRARRETTTIRSAKGPGPGRGTVPWPGLATRRSARGCPRSRLASLTGRSSEAPYVTFPVRRRRGADRASGGATATVQVLSGRLRFTVGRRGPRRRGRGIGCTSCCSRSSRGGAADRAGG